MKYKVVLANNIEEADILDTSLGANAFRIGLLSFLVRDKDNYNEEVELSDAWSIVRGYLINKLTKVIQTYLKTHTLPDNTDIVVKRYKRYKKITNKAIPLGELVLNIYNKRFEYED